MKVPVRVMVERGRKRSVASAFDWPGWDRNGRGEPDALRVLADYRPRYAKVAALAGLASEFAAAGELSVVERMKGTGTTDFHGVSARTATPELGAMTAEECDRKVALGVVTPLEARRDPVALQAHRQAFCNAIRDYNSRGAPARTWTVQFVIRRCAYHMLDHAWEMEDRDLSGASLK